jgi:trk system potassium uptake protein TrkH
MINKQIIFRLLGFLLVMESVFLFVSLLVSLFYREHDWLAFALAFGATFITGGSAVLFTQKPTRRLASARATLL